MNTKGPALYPDRCHRSGASIFDRLKGLTQSLHYTKPLLAGLYLNPAPALTKEARPGSLRDLHVPNTGPASS